MAIDYSLASLIIVSLSAIITLVRIIWTNKRMRESNKLTRTQLENTFRAELQIERADSGVGEKKGKPYGFFKPILRHFSFAFIKVATATTFAHQHLSFNGVFVWFHFRGCLLQSILRKS